MLFSYRCVDGSGRVKDGRLDADSLHTARARLEEKGWHILIIQSLADSAKPGPAGALTEDEGAVLGRWLEQREGDGGTRGIRLAELALFYRQLSIMLQAGIPLLHALENLSVGSDRLQGVLDLVVDKLKAGHSLSRALGRFPSLFPPTVAALVSAAEASGTMVHTFSRLADMTERRCRLRMAIASALTYPAILALTTLGLGILFILFAAPQDGQLLELMGGAPPWPTWVVMQAAAVLGSSWFWLAGVALVAGCGALMRHGLRAGDTRLRAQLDALLLRLPLAGVLTRRMMAARLLYVMALLLEQGVPLVGTLNLTANAAGNLAIAARIRACREAILEGTSLAVGLGRVGIFTGIVTGLVAVGEESGKLAGMLKRLADMGEQDVQAALLTFTSLLEPFLLIVAGVITGFVALASALPLAEVASRL